MDDDAGEDADRLVRALAPQLHVLAAVARSEHITRAAEDLGIPQPTVSRTLSRLQDEIGIELLERTGRGVRLSTAGRLLLPHVRRALTELAAGAAELMDESAGRITLAFLPTLGSHVVPALIRGFRADHPDVGFTLIQDMWVQTIQHVREGSVEIALTSPLPNEPGLDARVLHTQALLLVVPDTHPLAGHGRVRLSEAADTDMIALKPGRGIRHITDALCHRAGFVPRVSFEGDDTDTVRGLVAAGLGAAVLPAQPARPGDRVAGVAELELSDTGAERAVGVVWREARYEPPAVAAFRSFVLRHGSELVAGGLG